MIKSAVVLAAGMGIRIRDTIDTVPKGFISVGGQTLIERSIQKMKQCGIESIVIVTGHLSHYYEELARRDGSIQIVRNEIYNKTGSMYSLYCARHLIREDVLLFESDIIFETRAIETLLGSEWLDAILMSGKTHSGDEVYIETTGNRITAISKDRSRLRSVAGELVGISRISYSFYRTVIEAYETVLDSAMKTDYEIFMAEVGKTVPIQALKIDDLVWAEIDDERQYRRVVDCILPKLKTYETVETVLL